MFEIGDKVIYQGADESAYKREGTVVSIEDKDGKPQLTVELDGGETFTAPIDDWSRKFSNACTSTNSVVRNAMAARRTARNSVEVEISPGYAARVQHAMRDAARAISGVRVTGTNTLYCPDEDAADDVIDILKQAGLPKGEVWTNAKRTARNARTDWEQEVYNLTERIKKLVQKSQKENGEGYPTDVFKEALKAMRGY